MDRYVCIHGHFYQPPRENAWLEAVELQDSAYPYHDWNERITAECYAPNAASRILDGDGKIVRLVNNYARISFNFGPTLLAWMEQNAPDVLEGVVRADLASREKFSGHGSAIAQVYNHMILPLANARDQATQVVWGLREFEHRFGRAAEGMWLAETAADLRSLDVLASHGVLFTILAPRQARRVRRIGARSWRSVDGARIDPSRPYRVRLPSGRSIACFFYDGPASQEAAFGGMLAKGDTFVAKLESLFSDAREGAQLAHIATDGETYGHHHAHGDMALAYALQRIEERDDLRLTNYGEFLEMFPPTHEVQIHEGSSWSCVHGVERWRSDCGCNSGGHPGWTQAWRAPLREALDGLRDAVAPLYERRASELLRDPWAARDAYVAVVLDRSPESAERFFAAHAVRPLGGEDRVAALQLLELQRHAMLMYTSCGWFFDEVSGIETVQVLQYAGRVLQLAARLFPDDLEGPFLATLESAKGNVPEHPNGRVVYEHLVRPAVADLLKVAAHYGASRLFSGAAPQDRVYCYEVGSEVDHVRTRGAARLAVGRADVSSSITRASAAITYASLFFGEHNLLGGVRIFGDEERFQSTADELEGAFATGDFPSVIRGIDRHFGGHAYSFKSLFRDEQRRVLRLIVDSTVADVERAQHGVFDRHASLMAFLTDLRAPLPRALRAAAEAAVNADLREALGAEAVDIARVETLLEPTAAWGLELDGAGLGYLLEQRINARALELRAQPRDETLLEAVRDLVRLARQVPFETKFWSWQNIVYDILHGTRPTVKAEAAAGDASAARWLEIFDGLADDLDLRLSE